MYLIKPEIVLSSLRSNSPELNEILANYTNPTLIDDVLLKSFTPIFLIRHPALVMGSYWEVNSQSIGSDVDDEQFAWITSIRWVRILFEFYRRRTGEQPLVIDAEDVVYHTLEVTGEICSRFGLDSAGIALHWEPEPLSDRPGEFFKKRLRGSKGVERDKEAVSYLATVGRDACVCLYH